MREIVLDTETTGLSPQQGHRVVEIGAVELRNHVATGETYHVYINPEREMPDDAISVHGLTNEFLSDKPLFSEVVDGFVEFIGDAALVIHNAAFDMAFLNAELKHIGFSKLANTVVDTLELARKKFLGAPASLDALCKRFEIDASARRLHGALLDAELLAEVYLELCGGRQQNLMIDALDGENSAEAQAMKNRKYLEPRQHSATAEEIAAHEEFLTQIKSPMWKQV